MVSIIVACDQMNGIGYNGHLPWSFKEDMAIFTKITTNNTVIMGRKTYESIPEAHRPLKNRLNIVLTRSETTTSTNPLLKFANNLEDALKIANFGEIFIIGGSSLFEEVFLKKLCYKVYLNRLSKIYNCDTFFPTMPNDFYITDNYVIPISEGSQTEFVSLSDISLSVSEYLYRNKNEEKYLSLVRDVLEKGLLRPNRTGIDTLSIFGYTTRYSLEDNQIPLLTTKKMFFKGIVEELLWFLSGSTDAKELEKRGSKIWSANASRDVLDKLGFTNRDEGDLGPVYGHQWIFSGVPYVDCKTSYLGQGINQIAELINGLKTDPYGRRHIVSSWNVSQLKEMSLMPCHVLFQFYVHDKNDKKYLSCQMYQRSCDIGLGVPYNIASYSLLTHMIAHCCDMIPYEFIHVCGDAHIYVNHIEPLKEQLLRKPYMEPKLFIKNEISHIFNFQYSDFELTNYKSHDTIKMSMAV